MIYIDRLAGSVYGRNGRPRPKVCHALTRDGDEGGNERRWYENGRNRLTTSIADGLALVVASPERRVDRPAVGTACTLLLWSLLGLLLRLCGLGGRGRGDLI